MNEDGTYSGEESAEDSETAEEESATQSAMLSRNKMIVGLTTIIFAVQLILYYAVYYVQSLTKKSAGLNHHLRFRKTQLMNDYFPDYIL